MTAILARRALLKAGGAMVVALGAGRALAQIVPGADAALGKTNDLNEVDGFFAIHADGSVTLYCGKVDLGTGLRIAIPQMAAEELRCRGRAHSPSRRRFRPDTQPGPDRRLDRDHARRRADPPGRGDRARSADPHGRRTSRPSGGGA